MKDFSKRFIALLAVVFLFSATAPAQTTAFNYQGKLTDGGNPANGSFQMQFKLFDAVAGGNQIGTTMTDVPVTADQGVFGVKLDFGANALNGGNRWLEIAVRHNSGESYVTLAPREQIASSPYAVRTLSAQQADLALDSNKLGGIAAGEYVTNSTLQTNFIRNQTTPQAGSNFNISGSGTIGGSLNVNGAFPNGLFLSNGAATLRGTIVGNSVLFGTTTNNPLVLSSNGGANNGSVTLDTTGNFGIDAISPETKLTVHTFGSDYGITHTNGSIRLATYLGGNFNGGYFGTRSNHPLFFFTNDSGPLMTLTTAGNLGVGTTAPNAKLFVQGEATTGFGIAATGNASQSMSKGGWVKAMLVVNTTLPAGQQITRCFNSQAIGAAATTPPCGLSATGVAVGAWQIGFPVDVASRFASVTTSNSFNVDAISTGLIYGFPNSNSLTLQFGYPNGNLTNPAEFTVIVY